MHECLWWILQSSNISKVAHQTSQCCYTIIVSCAWNQSWFGWNICLGKFQTKFGWILSFNKPLNLCFPTVHCYIDPVNMYFYLLLTYSYTTAALVRDDYQTCAWCLYVFYVQDYSSSTWSVITVLIVNDLIISIKLYFVVFVHAVPCIIIIICITI